MGTMARMYVSRDRLAEGTTPLRTSTKASTLEKPMCHMVRVMGYLHTATEKQLKPYFQVKAALPDGQLVCNLVDPAALHF